MILGEVTTRANAEIAVPAMRAEILRKTDFMASSYGRAGAAEKAMGSFGLDKIGSKLL